MNIKLKLTEAAKDLYESTGIDVTPRRMQDGDAGHDLFACITEPLKIFPSTVEKIPTGACVWLGDSLAEQTGGDLALAGLYLPRSSCKGLVLENTVGLLDSGYQHESFIKFRNRSDEVIIINPGDRIAQLVVLTAVIAPWDIVQVFEDTTGRGEGDGSSGV